MSLDQVLMECVKHGMTEHATYGRRWECLSCQADDYASEGEWLDAQDRLRTGGQDDDDDPLYRQAWWDDLDLQYEAAGRRERRWLP